jgi:hypothetical protein
MLFRTSRSYCWIATVLAVVWCLPFFTPWVSPSALVLTVSGTGLVPVFPAGDTNPSHTVVCHCLTCAGGKKCCCLAAKTAQEGMAFRAACDNGVPTAIAATVVKVSVASTVAQVCFPTSLLSERLPLDATAERMVSRRPTPLLPPPRLS